jgi:hypothetical protein
MWKDMFEMSCGGVARHLDLSADMADAALSVFVDWLYVGAFTNKHNDIEALVSHAA